MLFLIFNTVHTIIYSNIIEILLLKKCVMICDMPSVYVFEVVRGRRIDDDELMLARSEQVNSLQFSGQQRST